MEITSIGFDRDLDWAPYEAPALKQSDPETFHCGNTDSTEGWTRLRTETLTTTLQEPPLDLFDSTIFKLLQTPVGEKLIAAIHADSHRTSIRYLREALEMKEYLTSVDTAIVQMLLLQSLIAAGSFSDAVVEEVITIDAILQAQKEFPADFEDLDVGEIHFDRGVAYLFLGNKEKGVEDLTAALGSGYPTAGLLLKVLNKLPPASSAPVSSDLSFQEQAHLYFAQGQYQEALVYAGRHLLIEDDDIDYDAYSRFCAACHMLAGEFDKAWDFYAISTRDFQFFDEKDLIDLALAHKIKGEQEDVEEMLTAVIDDRETGPDVISAFALKAILV